MQTAHCIKKIPFFVNDLFSSMISPEIVKKSELGFYTGKFSSNTAFFSPRIPSKGYFTVNFQ